MLRCVSFAFFCPDSSDTPQRSIHFAYSIPQLWLTRRAKDRQTRIVLERVTTFLGREKFHCFSFLIYRISGGIIFLKFLERERNFRKFLATDYRRNKKKKYVFVIFLHIYEFFSIFRKLWQKYLAQIKYGIQDFEILNELAIPVTSMIWLLGTGRLKEKPERRVRSRSSDAQRRRRDSALVPLRTRDNRGFPLSWPSPLPVAVESIVDGIPLLTFSEKMRAPTGISSGWSLLGIPARRTKSSSNVPPTSRFYASSLSSRNNKERESGEERGRWGKLGYSFRSSRIANHKIIQIKTRAISMYQRSSIFISLFTQSSYLSNDRFIDLFTHLSIFHSS